MVKNIVLLTSRAWGDHNAIQLNKAGLRPQKIFLYSEDSNSSQYLHEAQKYCVEEKAFLVLSFGKIEDVFGDLSYGFDLFGKDPLVSSVFFPTTLLSDIVYSESLVRSAYVPVPYPLSEVVLFNYQALSNLLPTASSGSTKSYLEQIFWLNRVGYISVMCLSAVLKISDPLRISLTPKEDFRYLEDYRKYLSSGIRKKIEYVHSLYDSVLSLSGRKLKICLDFLDVGAFYNGTSFLNLEFLKFISVDARFEVEVVMAEEAVRFHRLQSLYPKVCFRSDQGEFYDVYYKGSQMRSIDELKERRARALILSFMFHDSISYDCYYLRREWQEGVNEKLGDYVDILFFNSQHTCDLFHFRSGSSSRMKEQVVLLSTNPADYHDSDKICIDKEMRPKLLIMGNGYAHKMVEPTIEYLLSIGMTAHFDISALGGDDKVISGIHVFKSGAMPKNQVDDLYRSAEIVLYPSIYEGFGFPVMEGLSNEKIVVALASKLNSELADAMSGVEGVFIAYENWEQLRQVLEQLVEKRLVGAKMGTSCENIKGDAGWPEVSSKICDALMQGCYKLDVVDILKKCQVNVRGLD